ncbi:DUF1003 domain-containing protein [Chthonobacter albigriseus]|uniref:DUF1003 domain-containing protein n=1 Tax=Chthonobacter albigriseus TaxID=1683161 RepID=UPI0015EF58A6|nr:DUF1003 domain-containing protein [Chthonobacter albigriseus]
MTTARRPTFARLHPDGMAPILDRNIETLRARRRGEQARAGFQERLAEAITRFAGSMLFVYIHLAIVGAWIAVNLGFVPFMPVFDESFVILATAASVEAIFLSTFVLISQNRAAIAADRRAELDLQINLLAEHEITRLVALTRAIAEKLDVEAATDPALDEAEQDIAPEKVLEQLEGAEEE